jgi:predicted PhzF superfamily epimerase YddE/YHI9
MHAVADLCTSAAAGNSTVQHDFYSRFFNPWAGIDEDLVIGSAHSVLDRLYGLISQIN